VRSRPRAVRPAHAAKQRRLEQSINGVRSRMPEMSAYRTLSRWQRSMLRLGGVILLLLLIVHPQQTLIGVNAAVTTLYVAAFLYGLYLVRQALHGPGLVVISDEQARAIPDHDLPVYTVLVPAFREPEVIGQMICVLRGLEYPRERLDIKLLLEEDDHETIAAARASGLGKGIEIVRVPFAQPRTKPKACNYGLSAARGELVTIFDAEDRPEPLQLRRAVAAFRRLDPSVVCLQAKLSYHNAEQNLITRWFTIEYATWFSMLLPALAQSGGPVPLGGTSMHIKRAILELVGAWDPHNVTEDADLGVRLYRMGFRTAPLDSTTYEEANSDFVNWVKQRSRWYKGYLQTWLVHMRQPLRLRRELGTRRFLGFNLIVGATPFIALINPFFWLLTILWFLGKPAFIQALFPPWVYFPGMLCMIFGNFASFYLALIGARMTGRIGFLGAVLLSPIYRAMMSIAAIKAFLQLVTAPSFWEKTTHGLDRRLAPKEASVASQ
jgi:glycosyltransferase XagB